MRHSSGNDRKVPLARSPSDTPMGTRSARATSIMSPEVLLETRGAARRLRIGTEYRA